MIIPEKYLDQVKSRTTLRYYIGLIARLYLSIKFSFFRWVARRKGAKIGDNTNLSWNIVRMANSNLIIGEDCAIEAQHFDLRGGKIVIHDHVIINKEVTIIRVSHNIDNDEYFTTKHFPDLHIYSYSWIATGTKILPQVTHIAEGSICGAYSVISKNCEADGVYVGNPAKLIRKHNTRFSKLVVCSLQGGDYNIFKKARE